MIKKMLMIVLLAGSSDAMEEPAPYIKAAINIFQRDNKGQVILFEFLEFRSIADYETIGQLKKAIASKHTINIDRIILRALPRILGLVSSSILDDKEPLTLAISRYSNCFLLDYKKS
ncbi:hypothetical protein BH09DEP1_BH09DEP1_0860 [soil metagenome]